jgi:putative flippase GtrA
MVKFAIGGASGVGVGYLSGLGLNKKRKWDYKYAAAMGYALGFFVNYGVNLYLGNINV